MKSGGTPISYIWNGRWMSKYSGRGCLTRHLVFLLPRRSRRPKSLIALFIKQRQILVCSKSILLIFTTYTRATAIIFQFPCSQLDHGGSILTNAHWRGQGGHKNVHRGSVVREDEAPTSKNVFGIDLWMDIFLPKICFQF